MENLRWILIFAGVAILVLLYVSGRTSSGSSARKAAPVRRTSGASRPSNEVGAAAPRELDMGPTGDPLMQSVDSHGFTPPVGFDGFEVDPDDMTRPAAPRARAPHDFEAPEPSFDDESAARQAPLPPELRESSRASTPGAGALVGLGGLSQKIEAFGARLSSRRNERVAANPPPDEDGNEEPPAFASKIITLHVVARDGDRFDGQALIDCFERRELTFGEMNIFHSMHNGKTVFSVAKMVEPGWFDPHDLDSFHTPGITLILQLPGPVAADTAFEVLLSEAFEIAHELGGSVLDGERSTLSKQTAQHMREGVYEYMHRQKYFGSVAS